MPGVNGSQNSSAWPLCCLEKTPFIKFRHGIHSPLHQRSASDCCLQSSPLAGFTACICSNLEPVGDILSRIDAQWVLIPLPPGLFRKLFLQTPLSASCLPGPPGSLLSHEAQAGVLQSFPSSALPGKFSLNPGLLCIILYGAGGQWFSY